MVNDFHTHICGNCGHGWAHCRSTIASPAQNVQAHTCQRCGSTQYWVDAFPLVNIAVALALLAAVYVIAR
jgi:hypothetical protein